MVDGDRKLDLHVNGSHRVVVLGYAGEPFLRLTGAGVAVKERSVTAVADKLVKPGSFPALDANAVPLWSTKTSRHSFTWHDHRLGPRPGRRYGVGNVAAWTIRSRRRKARADRRAPVARARASAVAVAAALALGCRRGNARAHAEPTILMGTAMGVRRSRAPRRCCSRHRRQPRSWAVGRRDPGERRYRVLQRGDRNRRFAFARQPGSPSLLPGSWRSSPSSSPSATSARSCTAT